MHVAQTALLVPKNSSIHHVGGHNRVSSATPALSSADSEAYNQRPAVLVVFYVQDKAWWHTVSAP